MRQILRMLVKGFSFSAVITALMFSQELKLHYVNEFLSPMVEKVTETRGTGTIYYLQYKDRYYMMTNKHVCDISTDGKLNVSGKMYSILHKSKKTDLCIVESDREEGLALASGVSSFEPVYCIGFPLDFKKHMYQGHVSGTSSAEYFPWVGRINYMDISCSSAPGMSGSPILNQFGHVVGTLFAGDTRLSAGALVIPLEDMVKELDIVYNKGL